MEHLSAALCQWYAANQRKLPWRGTHDPYKIWLSEVILQQTRVAQGLACYQRFVEAFPTVADLAQASGERVTRLWQGLGYYSRARNLHLAAQQVVERHGGRFPESYAGLRALPGVGDYTAAAVASLAFGLPHAVVDGNVYRVISRLLGISTPIDSGAGKREFASLAQALLDKARPALHNQAMMEFGATLCTPKSPQCGRCPVADACVALRSGRVDELPVKAKKIVQKDRFLVYLFITWGDSFLARQRGDDGIWARLHEFPGFEVEGPLTDSELLASEPFAALTQGLAHELEAIGPPLTHLLTHQRIWARFVELRLQGPPPPEHPLGEYTWLSPSRSEDLAFPKLMLRFFDQRRQGRQSPSLF